MSGASSVSSGEARGWGARAGRVIVRWRVERDWNQERLAEEAGVSRTTLCRLERGQIAQPHAATLERIAKALGHPVEELLGDPPVRESGPSGWPHLGRRRRDREVDRATNPCVSAVERAEPGLFDGWSPFDWERLYGTFGVGGALSEEGVREAAGQINRGRETTRKLQILLETHLGETAATLIDALYRQVVVAPADGQNPSPRPSGRNSRAGTSS